MEDLFNQSPSSRLAALQGLSRSSLQKLAKDSGVKVLLVHNRVMQAPLAAVHPRVLPLVKELDPICGAGHLCKPFS